MVFILLSHVDFIFAYGKTPEEMKDASAHITAQFLTETYMAYRPLVFHYIYRKLNGCLEAEDLAQDTFLRLLEYRSMLRPETVRSFLYTIVRNLVTDYLRRHYKKQEVMACVWEGFSASVEEVESRVVADDLCRQELSMLRSLPSKVQLVYTKFRFDGKSASEISEELGIPKRTVEGYLLKGRKSVREYIKQCI